ncbi:fibronectin type III domain-containing protein [Pseudomonas reactans]|nr:fibronectin type III domain-containing protein [Pseudomonas reactans]
MSEQINVTFKSRWNGASAWSGTLEFDMTNNTGATIVNPEIKIQLGQHFTASANTGFDFIQTGDMLIGHLVSHLQNIANGETLAFSVNASFPNGGNMNVLPVAYWVNGKDAINGNANPDTTAPTAPDGLKSLSVTSNSASLSWNASTDNIGVDHYVVSYQAAGSTAKTHVATGTTAVLRNLASATTYTVSVVAVDAAGNTSTPSAAIQVTTEQVIIDTTAPSVPTALSVNNVTDSSVSLSWNASTDNVAVTGYKVKYTPEGGVSKTIDVTTTACNLNDLSADTQYSFCVAAFDASKNISAYSEAISAKTLHPVATSISFAPYVDVTINANWTTTPPAINTKYVTEALALGVKKFHLAFLVVDNGTKQLMWGNSYFPYNAIKPISDIINRAGGEAIVAFGGASGVDPSVCKTQAELTKIYLDLKKDFNVKHIDFDFETPSQYNYKVAFPAALDAQKQEPSLWFSLTLPVATTGLTSEGLAMINYAKEIGLTLSIQIMAMDYGPANLDMGDAAVSAIEGTKANLAQIYPAKSEADLYKMIGVIPMIGQNDAAGEMFSFQDATQTAQYSKQKGLNLVSIWSLVRDFPGMGDLATCTQNPQQTKDYEYTTTFLDALK